MFKHLSRVCFPRQPVSSLLLTNFIKHLFPLLTLPEDLCPDNKNKLAVRQVLLPRGERGSPQVIPAQGHRLLGHQRFRRSFPDSDGFQRTSDTWVPALLQGFGPRVFQGAVGINDHWALAQPSAIWSAPVSPSTWSSLCTRRLSFKRQTLPSQCWRRNIPTE